MSEADPQPTAPEPAATPAPSAPSDDTLPIARLHRYISEPSIVSGMIGAGLGVVYGMITLELIPGTKIFFAALTLIAAAIATVVGDMLEQAFLAPVKALKTRAHSADLLAAAARAAHRFPDRSFLYNLLMWGTGAITVTFGYRVYAGPAGFVTASRIALLGFGLAPLVSLITYLLVLERSRPVVERICALGLTAKQATEALASSRRQLRLRLMLLTAIAGATPATFIVDVILANGRLQTEQLLAAPTPAAQQALVERFAGSLDLESLFLGVLLVAVGIGTAILAGRSLVRPLRRLAQEAGRVATGALDTPAFVLADDEVWSAAAAFTAMHTQLRDALSRLRAAGLRLNDTTDQLMGASTSQQAGAAEQAAALNETFATTEELARSAGQIAENAGEVAAIAERTLSSAQKGQHSARTFFQSMVRMAEENRLVADSVLKLNKRVQQIGKVVEFIHEVGDKSDLLALNAELEGTKAGEVGRGFSLVAAEMRRLAESVVQSTHEIERLIDEIRDGTNAAVMATESGLKGMDNGNVLAKQVLDRLEEIVALASVTSEAVRSISLSTQQQQTGSNQLTDAMAEILRITQEGAKSGDQMALANQTLSTLSARLGEAVQRVKLDESGSHPQPILESPRPTSDTPEGPLA